MTPPSALDHIDGQWQGADGSVIGRHADGGLAEALRAGLA